jgi:hypothetical protein
MTFCRQRLCGENQLWDFLLGLDGNTGCIAPNRMNVGIINDGKKENGNA